MRIIDLNKVNEKQIRLAGPRYTPGVDPKAPNVSIAPLLQAFDGLAFSTGLRDKVKALREGLAERWRYAPSVAKQRFAGRRHTPDRIITLLTALEAAGPGTVSVPAAELVASLRRVRRSLQKLMAALQARESSVKPDSEEHTQIRSQVYETGRVDRSVGEVGEYADSPGFALLTTNALFLLGEWGTGKTHFLCDLTRQRIRDGLPTLLFLAQHLPHGMEPLESLCRATGLARDRAQLLADLQALGEKHDARALLLIDGINEGDRRAWRAALGSLARELDQYAHVGLAVSCRQPFEQQLLRRRVSRRYVHTLHLGFSEVEFNAQVEFFQYYGIPSPHVPLLTPEFSRPLFLKLLCEAIKDLGARGQQKKLRDIASGLKGITHVLEFFAKNVGRKIEDDLRLDRGTCWRVLKGDESKQAGGIAGAMAERVRDHLTLEECRSVVAAVAGLATRAGQELLLKRMTSEGILTEGVHWDGEYREVIRFPYQRFGDHLVARHVLGRHLNATTEQTVRRSFHRHRPLGRVFALEPHGLSFALPGLASAIMLEFPERVKKKLPQDKRELVFYLPKAAHSVRALKDVFLDGLYWRSADSFNPQTSRLVAFFLEKCGDLVRNEALEVLVGLASRPGHPYSAGRLHSYLVRFAMPDRDLFWSEFLRLIDESSAVYRLLEWVERSADKGFAPATASNTVTLLSLLLTTTRRALRDRVTRALLLIGLHHAPELFKATEEGFAFNDPYVPERMLAACYGVVMCLWADPKGGPLRAALPQFARRLLHRMFLPGASQPTRHVLTREYALGLVTLARKVSRSCVPNRLLRFLAPPFDQIPSLFPDPSTVTDEQCADAKPALHMDFENYTIGRLVPDRGNYDSKHPIYKEIRRQILWRMLNLGYSYERFRHVDDIISQYGWRQRSEDEYKVDRYGKKYSWIAFFEMYGTRLDAGALADRRLAERTSDCDIDPSFPDTPRTWMPRLPRLFKEPWRDARTWLEEGPRPRFEHLLQPAVVGEAAGRWVLLDGSIEQASSDDPRRVFTLLRGLLVRDRDAPRFVETLGNTAFPGNFALPDPYQDHYTYAGEIPWSSRFGTYLRRLDGRPKRNLQRAFERLGPRGRTGGVPVEVPVHRFSWERYHSALNQVTGVTFPAPALCQALGLVNHSRELDLYEKGGRVASLFRVFRASEGYFESQLLYIRSDLLDKYLRQTRQCLVWAMWGERGFKHTGDFGAPQALYEGEDVRRALQAYSHVHKSIAVRCR